MTEVFALKLDDMDMLRANWDALTSLVSHEKRERLRGIRVFDDAARVLAADLLVRLIIRGRTGLRNDGISFGMGQYGKPFLLGEQGSTLRFNVSHSGRWVAVCAGSCENGVDIQEIRAVRGQTDLDAFFEEWVVREARLKCTGAGILGKPDESLFVRSYSPDAGTKAAVCAVEDGFSDLRVKNLRELIENREI
ncbi:MAG: hypothetical protein FWE20_02060 [Defluviitaleaceae bacterium]|nr:hypothetical protein [Defluviitaleaceae bacterium]